MKLVLVASLAALLGLGMSGNAQAHEYGTYGYGAAAGGSFYWADDGYVIGLSYGVPPARVYYAPPSYGYAPRAYRHGRWHDKHYRHHGSKHGKAYKKGYRKGYREGRRHDRHHDRRDYRYDH